MDLLDDASQPPPSAQQAGQGGPRAATSLGLVHMPGREVARPAATPAHARRVGGPLGRSRGLLPHLYMPVGREWQLVEGGGGGWCRVPAGIG